MKVAEVAAARGVSPRRVRALIATGQITAHRVGGAWDVTEFGRVGQVTRRPLSARSREMLARALHQRSLSGLTGHDKARTAARIGQLRTADDPASLLMDWWTGSDPAAVNLGTNLVAHARGGHRDYVANVVRRARREYLRDHAMLAEVVITERAIAGLSTDALAASARVAREDVIHIERGDPPPSPAAIRRVLRALNVTAIALPDLPAVVSDGVTADVTGAMPHRNEPAIPRQAPPDAHRSRH